MAKAGMRRPDVQEPHGTESNHKRQSTNDLEPVPEIQGKAKTGNKKAGKIYQNKMSYEQMKKNVNGYKVMES